MGTALTGLEIKDTYDGLVKTTDNGPISGTLKALSDGLGNDSTLSLSTTAASIAGTLAVSGNATFDTNTLFVDAASNEVGIGTTSPSGKLHISATSGVASLGSTALAIRDSVASNYGFDFTLEGVSSGDMSLVRTELDVQSQVMTFKRSNGNVGIGKTAPDTKLHVAGSDAWITLQRTSGTTNIIDFTDSAAARIGYIGAISSNISVLSTGSVVFGANSAEIGRFTSNGLTFNGDTAAANALDDYEEGTYTPTLTPTTSGSYTLATDVRYTKIGREVYVQGLLTISSVSSPTGTAVQLSLPLAIGGTAPTGGRFSGGCITADASASYVRTVRSNFGSAGNSYVLIDVDASTLETNDEVMFGITYTV